MGVTEGDGGGGRAGGRRTLGVFNKDSLSWIKTIVRLSPALALLLAGDGICRKAAADGGEAGLGEQMVMRPVAALKGLKNSLSDCTLFASVPQVFPSQTQRGWDHLGECDAASRVEMTVLFVWTGSWDGSLLASAPAAHQ